MYTAETVQQFASFCGTEKYARFLQALRTSARQAGRLMHWQQQALKEFSEATRLSIPLNYEELIRLYSFPDRYVSLNIPREASSHLRFDFPVVRRFHSVNQMASGGSHLTVFTVRLSTHSSPYDVVVRDECPAGENPDARERALEELRCGVEEFLVNKLDRSIEIHALMIALLDFEYHETDFRPLKYRLAIKFLLEDLLCEQQCNRVVPEKMVGVPL